MKNICDNCKYGKKWSALNVGPKEARRDFISCQQEKATLSTLFVQPDFGCIYFEEKGNK